MEISIPQQVEDQLEEGERVVGFMMTLFQEQIFFTKRGCSTESGCSNFLFHEGRDNFSRLDVDQIRAASLTKHELLFVRSFLWN